jgi:hypothetical protein
LIGIYLKGNKSNEFIVGLLQGYVGNILTFISISQDSEPQEVVCIKLNDIIKLESNTKYLNNLNRILNNKNLRKLLGDLKGKAKKNNIKEIFNKFIKQKEIITIIMGKDELNIESGYLNSYDDKYYQLEKVNSYGEKNGIEVGRIDKIIEVRSGYKEQVRLKHLNINQ